jgi:predicted nuclease with TOPRIM domain
MTGKALPRHFAAGLLVGLLVLPPEPARAQWTVFDPTQYALQVRKRIEELSRWAETARHYQEMYAKAVEQLTTLRGVLRTADRTLFKNQQIAFLANDVGRIIGDTQKLKRRLEGMIRYQIGSLRSIDDRLSQGIFDPDADLRDLENYLLYTMGRDARQTVDRMMRTARADAQLAAWIDEKNRLMKELAILSGQLQQNQELLKQEQALALPENRANVGHLNEMISRLEARVDDLKKQIKELEEKIARRIKDHGLRLQDMENFGHEVLATTEMWKELQVTKDDLQQTLDNLILGGTTTLAE